VKEFIRRFFDNMSNPPEPGPELIPTRLRIPFFVGLIVVSLLALAMIVRFVVVPGIGAQQSGALDHPQSGSPQ
jgi:hypothetical protein